MVNTLAMLVVLGVGTFIGWMVGFLGGLLVGGLVDWLFGTQAMYGVGLVGSVAGVGIAFVVVGVWLARHS